MKISEIAPQKPLTPDQARIKSMRDRVKRDQQAVKSEKARQQMHKAQQSLATKF